MTVKPGGGASWEVPGIRDESGGWLGEMLVMHPRGALRRESWAGDVATGVGSI